MSGNAFLMMSHFFQEQNKLLNIKFMRATTMLLT